MLEDKAYMDINNYSKRKFANIKNKINFNEKDKHFLITIKIMKIENTLIISFLKIYY